MSDNKYFLLPHEMSMSIFTQFYENINISTLQMIIRIRNGICLNLDFLLFEFYEYSG